MDELADERETPRVFILVGEVRTGDGSRDHRFDKQDGREASRVLAGVDEPLPRLRKAGLLLGIRGGVVEAAAQIKLARANLNRFFCFRGYGSDSADRGELTRKAIKRADEILSSALDSQYPCGRARASSSR